VYCLCHKVRIRRYRVPQCMSLVRIGTLPPPLSSASVPLPGGGHTRLRAGEGLEESQFRRLEKKLSTLPTLWSMQTATARVRYQHPSSLKEHTKLAANTKRKKNPDSIVCLVAGAECKPRPLAMLDPPPPLTPLPRPLAILSRPPPPSPTYS
jgi:hypothetical protein